MPIIDLLKDQFNKIQNYDYVIQPKADGLRSLYIRTNYFDALLNQLEISKFNYTQLYNTQYITGTIQNK